MAPLTTQDILREKNTTDPNSITSLSLTHKALSNVSCLSEFKNLERLDLTFNNLSSLKGLEGCVNLKWLCVQQNKLENLKGIESLTNLTVFNAGKNKLRSMDEVKHLLNLRALILNDNEIASISGLDQLTELNTLVLSRNPITKMENSLAKLKSIVKVSLSNCQLEEIDSSIKACTELEQLRLSHNDIKTLPAELGYNKKLQILDIGNNMLSRWSDLEALSSLRTLKNLNVLGNPIAEKAKLLKKINKLAPSLQILNSKRMDRLSSVQNNQKVEHAVVDAENDVEPLKKKKDSSERFMDADSDKHVLNDDRKPKKRKGFEEDGNPIKKEKFGKIKAKNLGVVTEDYQQEDEKNNLKRQTSLKKHVAFEGAKMEPDEDNHMKKAKKKKENCVDKEMSLQETNKTELVMKSKRKLEKPGLDVIDDKERSFMECLRYDATDITNSDDGERRGRSVGKTDSIGALVTYPGKNKKAKGAQTSVFELFASAPDVGSGGPSAWDV